MKNGAYFLWRNIQSIVTQTFNDYEIIITQEGKMAENTNEGIRRARGELIKVLYLDDYFAHEKALQIIVDNFKESDDWLVTGCLHQQTGLDPHTPHYPTWNHDMNMGNNTIGSPSVLTIRNLGHLLFDERLSWVLDCDLYSRYYEMYGAPKIVNDLNVIIGLGEHQTTHVLSDEQKLLEVAYLRQK